jgi:hypothetical protein
MLCTVGTTSRPPRWLKPQLTRLVNKAPTGDGWLHEIKYDGYRMHARIDGGKVALLTRTGLDWSHRYRRTIDEQRWQIARGLLCSGRPNHARVEVDDLRSLLFAASEAWWQFRLGRIRSAASNLDPSTRR